VESSTIKHDFTDERSVRDSHRHSSKQCLQVVRQLSTSHTKWIHRDEDGTVRLERNLGSFKSYLSQLFTLRLLDTDDQLGDHRENPDLNSVELIEARPGTARSKAFKELTHGTKV